MAKNGKSTIGPGRPKLIVMPFQPAEGQLSKEIGLGLGIHFFLGNLFCVHKGLLECWFGWRVKKIFPEPGLLQEYCRGNRALPNIREIGSQESVRFWLEGQYQQKGEEILLALVLHDTNPINKNIPGPNIHYTNKNLSESRIKISMAFDDGLLGFRTLLFDWLETCGLPFSNVENAIWPEHISIRGLDFLGRALENIYINYINSIGVDSDLIDLAWFDRAVDQSKNSYLTHDLKGWGLCKNREYQMAEIAFASALDLNPDGLGALSGMMWCAVYTENRARALKYALKKAGCRGEDPERARAFVDKKFMETPLG
jgi:tetratricopeptide (TPR) repeat protein